MKIKVYVNFYQLSEIGTLRVERNFMAAFLFWLKSITKYKTGLRSGGYYNNSNQKSMEQFVFRYLQFENSHVSQFLKKLYIFVKSAG